jgi:hypothetical protein
VVILILICIPVLITKVQFTMNSLLVVVYQFCWIVSIHEIKDSTNKCPHDIYMYICTDYTGISENTIFSQTTNMDEFTIPVCIFIWQYITMEGCRHIFREMKFVCRFPTYNHWRFLIKCMICYKLFLFNINLQPEILNRRHHYVIFSSLKFCVIVKFYIFVSDVKMLGHSVQSVCFFGHSLGIDKCSIYTGHF